MAENNTSNIGFEKQIWDAACVLRGNIDASEYKSVVLGLIFLKYISDRFEAKYKELVEEGDGFEEDQDEYTAENIFFVPENARWSAIADAAHTPELGTVIDDAMRSIEKENKRLKDILPKNFARPELDKRRLGEVVDLFTNIQMIEHGNSKDILGRTYEYCLSKFAEQEGKLAGEFYTPSCVVRTLVEVLQPFNGRVYDPCCGSGGMFVQSAKLIENHGGNINKISVFGQDSNPTTWKMAQIGEWHTDYYAKRVQQAVQANLSLTTIKSLPIPLLDEAKMSEYLSLILPLIKAIKTNEAQNEKLAALRDNLLPKLMSGEIDVSDIQL